MANEKKMEEQIKDIACSTSLKSFQRNRYFYGKLLTVRDFEEEQRYFIEKQRLINRLIHGEGVVCGLKVEKVEDKDGFIRITPGVALDCCGREIVVPEPVKIDLSKKIALEDFGDEETITRWVTIRYSACGKEPVPAYSAESSCEETCCYSRIMEGYEIDILEEKPEECFPSDEGICAVWPNPARVAKKLGPIYFERIMPKVVKKGERFKVTIKIKAMEDIPSLKIEEKLPPGLKVYKGLSSLERKDVKKGEEFYHTYWVKPKDIIGKFDITGKILNIPNIPPLDLPRSPIETSEEPEVEKSKSFVEYWIRECPESPKEPAVLLASIKLQKRTNGSFKITEVDNAIIENGEFKKSLVFSNPRLYELIKCVEKQEGPQGPRGPKGEQGPPGPGLEEDLTYIQEIYWKHGININMKLDDFINRLTQRQRRLGIQFSRNIKSGLDENTFLVAIKIPVPHLIPRRRIEVLNYQLEYLKGKIVPQYEGDQRRFLFLIDEREGAKIKAYIEYLFALLRRHEQQERIQVLIQIKCDFILDEKGRAVAGHHIGGKEKSGLWIKDKYNIPGGIFESWFYLVPE